MAWAPSYVTTTELSTYMRDTSGTIPSAQLAWAIAAASRTVDTFTGRQFGQVSPAEERFYTARYDYERGQWVVDTDDLATTSGVEVEVDGTAATAVKWEPRNAVARGMVWTRLTFDTDGSVLPTGAPDEVGITASWGWSAVPDTIEQATLLQASRLMERRVSPFGVAGSPDVGSELRLLSKVDADVAVILAHYRRPGAVG